MKLYVIKHDNGALMVVGTPDGESIYDADGRKKVYAIDAEEYVPPAPKPERRMVKAYVSFDPSDSDGQDIWAFSTIEAAMDRRGCPIFEIEMREVPLAPKRETGWVVDGPNGSLYGPSGFGSARPFVFSTQSAANELAGMLCYGCTAIEVYRDTMDPVNGGSDA